MRLKITLKSPKNKLLIPFNYNHILSAIIYNKISDLEFANKIHSSQSYKFFTFSQINVYNFKIIKNKGILSQNGVIDFQISSPDDYLIKSMVDGFLNDLNINFVGKTVTVQKIELLKLPIFKNKMTFNTLSPIITRTKKEVNGEMKIWDLPPSDHFFNNLENNLINKYNEYYNLDNVDKEINIYSEMNKVKRKRITIEKGEKQTHHRAYMMDLILEGDVELIKFAYDVGVGEKSALGFGMIETV